MKFKFTAAFLMFIQAALFPCTNFMVTKSASADGSTMITYTADSYYMYGELYHYPAARYPEGAMLEVYEWDTGKYLGKIKQARQTYNVVGNMNEHQLAIGETTFGGRGELVNEEGIIDYGSLIYITLQRAKTAREAIKIMDELVQEYGYYSSGESFSIADPNEVWIMEMIGKGKGNKGAVWAAVRIPDGCVSGHANQARITNLNFKDKENFAYSPDVVSFAREKGYFSGKDEEFNFSDAYAPLDFGAVRFCDARVWSLFRRVNPEMDKYITYIRGENSDRMPLYIKPEKKISLEDVMGLMRDHYEGTELDMTKGAAAGSFNMPYRWRPLVWECDGVEYFHERPVSTPQTGWSFISQSRSWLPNEVGGVLWYGMDDTYMTVYTPFYASMVKMPYNYAQGRASLTKFSWDSAFWVFNFVSNYVYPRYSIMIGDVEKVRNELEGIYLSNQKDIEEKALALSKTSKRDAVEFLNNYSVEMADNTIKKWKQLGEHLIMKYIDGVAKDESGKVVNVGYSEEFRKVMAAADGDKLKMKKLPEEIDREFNGYKSSAEKYLGEKNYSKAKEEYNKALKLKPEDTEVKLKLTKLDDFLNRVDELYKSTLNISE